MYPECDAYLTAQTWKPQNFLSCRRSRHLDIYARETTPSEISQIDTKMDGAASIITVISLALSSAHCIVKALSGIKNAPHTVQQMSASVLTLSKLLEQLKAYSDGLHYAADLPDSIRKCYEDLGQLKKYVEEASTKKSNKVGRLKKNCKVMLQGREWDRRSALVQQHYAALSLQINIIEGYAYTLRTRY